MPGRAALPVLAAALAAALAGGASRAAEPDEAREAGEQQAERVVPSDLSTLEVRIEAEKQPYPLDFGERIDRTHDAIFVGVQQLVEATDRRFAVKDRELVPVPVTPFRLGLTGEIIDRARAVDFDVDVDIDVSLKLPNIERRLRIFVTSDDVGESPNVQGDRSGVRAGLRFNPLQYFDFDVGLRADLPPVAFASARWSRAYRLAGLDLYPFAKLFAETDDGLGASGAITFDRWAGASLLRSASFMRWLKDRDETEWTQAFTAARVGELTKPDRYGTLVRSRDIGRGYGLTLLGRGDSLDGADEYEASVFYKRPIRHRWLYLSIEPFVRWEREFDWSPDPGLRIGLDALFWDLARARADTR